MRAWEAPHGVAIQLCHVLGKPHRPPALKAQSFLNWACGVYHDPEDEPEAEPYDESVEAKERTVEEWKGGPEGCVPQRLSAACFLQEVLQFLLRVV